jgi:hypothetical protein
MWHSFVKPWQTTESWEKQVGTRVEPVEPMQQVCAAEALVKNGKLLKLEVPRLAIHNKGRPTNTPTKEEQARVKDFMEEVRMKGGAGIAAAEHVTAGSAFRNQGGRGSGKSCIRCRLAGSPTRFEPARVHALAVANLVVRFYRVRKGPNRSSQGKLPLQCWRTNRC